MCSIDPVSDPEYNFRQIIKQSLLLEDHLVERNKRCPDCIAKHFLTIIALSEEAVSLAGRNATDYPMITENPCFYENLFQMWLNDKRSDFNLLKIADSIRNYRKRLVFYYILRE